MRVNIKNIIRAVLVLLRQREVRQAGTLYGAMMFNIFFGIGVSIVNTRLLGPEAYGQFKLLGNLFALAGSLATFGYFNSIGRLLAQPEHKQMRGRLVGAGLIISAVIAGLIVGAMLIFSFFINDVFSADLASVLRLISPLLFTVPLRICLENLCQGDNRIGTLSLLRVLPQILYLVAALGIGLYSDLTLISALLLQLGFLALVMLGIAWLLHPRLKGVKEALVLAQDETRRFGFHIYLGSVASVASAQLFGLLIGYFVDVEAVGFYSLAVTVCAPLTFIGSVFGSTYFKKFASCDAIPKNIFLVTAGISVVALVGFLLAIKPIILLLYGDAYEPAITLAYVMGGGFLIHGLGDFYNRFLCAHGKGKLIRNGALLTGAVSIVAGFILTKYFGSLGGAGAKFLTSATYFLMMLFCYIRRESFAEKKR